MKISQEQLTELISKVANDTVSEIVGEKLKDVHEKIATNQQQMVDAQKDFIKELIAKQSEDKKVKSKTAKLSKVAMLLTSLGACKGDSVRAEAYAKEHFGDDDVVKALGETTGAGGGFLIPDDMADEITELLRPAAIVRALGAVTVDMPNGQLVIPKFKTGSSASYFSENTDVPKSEPSFEQLTLTARKLGALVPMSNDLLNDSPLQAARDVREDMTRAVAAREDLAFIRGSGVNDTPKGLLNWVVAANSFATAGTTLANVLTDLGTAVQKLEEADLDLINPGWIFTPRSKRHLMTLRDGVGGFVFRPEMATGKLMGFPFMTTTQVPNNLGGGSNESEVYFADFGHLRIGETGEIRVAMAENVAYNDGSNVVSAFSLDQTVLRIITRHDFGPRQLGEEIALITAIRWGS